MEDFAFTDFTFATGVIQIAFGIALLLFTRAWWRLQAEVSNPREYMVRIYAGVFLVLVGSLLITPRADLINFAAFIILPGLICWVAVRKGLPEVSKQIVVLLALAAIGIATALTVTVEYYSREEFSFGGFLMLMSGISMAGGWGVAASAFWLIFRKKYHTEWRSKTFPMQTLVNSVWFGGVLLAILLFIFNPVNSSVIYVIKGLSIIGGFLFMLPFSSRQSAAITYLLMAIVGFCVGATGYVLKQPLGVALGMLAFGGGLRATMIRGEENGSEIQRIMQKLFGATKEKAVNNSSR